MKRTNTVYSNTLVVFKGEIEVLLKITSLFPIEKEKTRFVRVLILVSVVRQTNLIVGVKQNVVGLSYFFLHSFVLKARKTFNYHHCKVNRA